MSQELQCISSKNKSQENKEIDQDLINSGFDPPTAIVPNYQQLQRNTLAWYAVFESRKIIFEVYIKFLAPYIKFSF